MVDQQSEVEVTCILNISLHTGKTSRDGGMRRIPLAVKTLRTHTLRVLSKSVLGPVASPKSAWEFKWVKTHVASTKTSIQQSRSGPNTDFDGTQMGASTEYFRLWAIFPVIVPKIL